MRVFICGGPYKEAIGRHGFVISPGDSRNGYWVQYNYWPDYAGDYDDRPMIGSDGMAVPKQCLHYFDKCNLRFVE